MKISLGTKWDYDFVKKFSQLGVDEIFGSFRWSTLGSGRGAAILPELSIKFAHKYIREVHDNGMKFCYTWNASCLGNKEFDPAHVKEIQEELNLFEELGIDAITVTVPSLIGIIKHRLPNVKVKASIINQIGSVQSVQYFTEYLGVDEFVLGIDFNRNFKIMEAVRKATSKPIEVIANESCLFHCPYRNYHYNIAAHASKNDDKFKGKFVDYCIANCMKQRVIEHGEIIKCRFIRPEDIHFYEDLGMDKIKISARHLPSEWGYRSAKAYIDRKYNGNLADIVSPVAMAIPEESIHKLPGLSDEENEIVAFVLSHKAPNIFIDNSKLDGMLDHFIREGHKCDYTLCGEECRYCFNIADKSISADPDEEVTANFLGFIEQTLEQVSTGELADEIYLELDNLEWNNNTKIKHEKCLEMVPIVFRKYARKKTTKIAEELAKRRGSDIIEDQDMIIAVWQKTPSNMKNRIMQVFENLDCSQYIK